MIGWLTHRRLLRAYRQHLRRANHSPNGNG
jgi:hypothetical protein